VRVWPAMVLTLVAVVLVIGWRAGPSLLDSDDAGDAASATGGSALSTGAQVWDDMGRVRGLTESTGEELRSSVRELSDDADVQDATLAVAWKATCGVVFGEVQLERGSVARSVLDLAATLGIEFLNEGEYTVADAVLQAVNESANDAAEKCANLRNAGF